MQFLSSFDPTMVSILYSGRIGRKRSGRECESAKGVMVRVANRGAFTSTRKPAVLKDPEMGGRKTPEYVTQIIGVSPHHYN